MTFERFHYVCDTCGAKESGGRVPEDGTWTCPNCGSHTAWEFDDAHRANADLHATHIQKGIGKGGIFRSARRVTHA